MLLRVVGIDRQLEGRYRRVENRLTVPIGRGKAGSEGPSDSLDTVPRSRRHHSSGRSGSTPAEVLGRSSPMLLGQSHREAGQCEHTTSWGRCVGGRADEYCDSRESSEMRAPMD